MTSNIIYYNSLIDLWVLSMHLNKGIILYIRNTIYKLQILFSLIILGIFFLFYLTYKNSYQTDLDTYIQKEIEFNKNRIIDSLKIVSTKYEDKRNFFLNIHNYSLKSLKEDSSLTLKELKKDIKDKYNLTDIEIEFYLIDKNYVIYETTFPKDLGFDLSIIAEAKDFLDKTKIDKKVYLADNISEDAIDGKYKLYSYSKLKDDTFLELGFTDTKLFNSISNDLNNHKNLSLYRVNTNEKYQYYYKMEKRNKNISKEEHFNKLRKFLKDENSDDIILNTIRSNKSVLIEKDNEIISYIPLLEYKEFSLLKYTDIVMEIKIDITQKIKALENFKKIFIFEFVITILFLYFMFNWIKKNFTKPIEVIATSIKNEEVIDYFTESKNDCELTYISNEYNKLFNKLKDEIQINKDLTYIDALTKIKNRKAYNEKLKEDLSLKKRYSTPFCMLILDIDNFKKINDFYGHNIGDKVLIELSKLIQNNIRVNDNLFRIGGEEFVIIFSQTTLENAKIVSEKVRNIIQRDLNTIENQKITVSIGLSEITFDDNEDTIFKRVDTLMYKSKNNGKNKVSIG